MIIGIFAFLETSFGGGLVDSLRLLFPSGDVMTRLGDMYGRSAAHWKARVVSWCLVGVFVHLKERSR
jgi:hypothetical protein